MKCYKYQVFVQTNNPQTRLYIPKKGVLRYDIESKEIDFLSDGKERMKEAKQAIEGTLEDSKYLGEISLPTRIVNSFMRSVYAIRRAHENHQRKKEILETLISLLK